ncbi:MAG: GxxExxY protein [bacterium]
MTKLIYKELSDQVLGAAFTVHSTLGPGLLESLYQKAMCIELRERHLHYQCESPYTVFYKGENIGVFYADTINYLKISNIAVGYLINFNSISAVWKRFYHQRL